MQPLQPLEVVLAFASSAELTISRPQSKDAAGSWTEGLASIRLRYRMIATTAFK
jgi:hypothetical protein